MSGSEEDGSDIDEDGEIGAVVHQGHGIGTKKAAAAMAVGVGSFSDPPHLPASGSSMQCHTSCCCARLANSCHVD